MREKWLIWCDLNDEQDALEKAFGDDCVSIRGAQSADEKERLETLWRETDVPVLITKPSVFGWGMNWQLCNKMIFVGISHSFEAFYQAVRRCWRFGQTRQVICHVITSEAEGRVLDNLKRKQADADAMGVEMARETGAMVRKAITGTARDGVTYAPREPIHWPEWLNEEGL